MCFGISVESLKYSGVWLLRWILRVNGIDHRPEILQGRIELNVVGGPKDQTGMFADSVQAGEHLLADVRGGAKWQGVLFVERAPEA